MSERAQKVQVAEIARSVAGRVSPTLRTRPEDLAAVYREVGRRFDDLEAGLQEAFRGREDAGPALRSFAGNMARVRAKLDRALRELAEEEEDAAARRWPPARPPASRPR